MEEENSIEKSSVSRSAWITLIILSSTLLTVFFSETMLLPAIPEIMNDFQIPYGTAAWIFSGYMIVAAVMTPIAGKMSDIYGKKRVLLVLLALYIAGTVIGGFANNISVLLVSRIIQGVGLAAIPAAFSLVADSFPSSKIAIAIGVFGSAYSAGSVVGLLAGARIIESFGWHSTFFFIAPVAALVTFMIVKFVKKPKVTIELTVKEKKFEVTGNIPTSNSLDIKGALALSATIISFLIALTLVQIGVSSENILQIGIAFTSSLVSLLAFVIIERRVASPLLDFRLLKDRVLLPSYIIMMVQGIIMFLAYPTIVQLVRSPVPLGFGGNAIDAANVQLPFMITFLIFASVTPFIINKIGNIKPIIIGTAVTIIGSIGLFVFHSTGLEVSANLILIATGLSLANLSAWNVILTSSPKQFMGISTGAGALLMFIGMSIGPALAGVYMADHQTIPAIHGSYPSLRSYDLIFITSAFLSIASLGFSIVLRKKLFHHDGTGQN